MSAICSRRFRRLPGGLCNRTRLRLYARFAAWIRPIREARAQTLQNRRFFCSIVVILTAGGPRRASLVERRKLHATVTSGITRRLLRKSPITS